MFTPSPLHRGISQQSRKRISRRLSFSSPPKKDRLSECDSENMPELLNDVFVFTACPTKGSKTGSQTAKTVLFPTEPSSATDPLSLGTISQALSDITNDPTDNRNSECNNGDIELDDPMDLTCEQLKHFHEKRKKFATLSEEYRSRRQLYFQRMFNERRRLRKAFEANKVKEAKSIACDQMRRLRI